MPKLYIIRHAQVQINPQVPSEKWALSEEGVQATQRLVAREQWPDVVRIYHSPEPKAVQTAQVAADHFGLPMKMHLDLRELRADVGFLEAQDFRARVGAYLAGQEDPDFEPYQEAALRIERCIEQIVAEEQGHSVAVVSHGRILTVLYSRILGRRLGVDEWQSIQLPDLSVIDLETWTVKRGFLSQASATTKNEHKE